MIEEPKKPMKKRWLVTLAAAVSTVVTLIVDNAQLLDAAARALRSIAD